MLFKNFKKSFSLLLISLFIIPSSVYAYSKYLIPGGENIGIKVNTKGVMVVGVYEVDGTYPATDAGIKIGDIITKVSEDEVDSIDSLINKINESNSDNIRITYMRDKKSYDTNLKLYKDNDVYKTGLYVKDSITGIGTLSFIDPETKLFGALGHEIIEQNTGQMLEIKDGKIFSSSVTNIERSESGSPGSKNAEFNNNDVEGAIFENTESGIFGEYIDELPDKEKYKVAEFSDIKTGEAKILTVIEGNQIAEYSINIIKLNNSKISKTKNILFEVTDKTLIEKTGGIVQGMSGSPIIQDDYIIGAVTHVVVDNPLKGYGILITNMLEEAEN